MASPGVILSAYTGYLLVGSFGRVQEYAEQVLGRPIFTHEFASEKLQEELRKAVMANGDFERACKAIDTKEAN